MSIMETLATGNKTLSRFYLAKTTKRERQLLTCRWQFHISFDKSLPLLLQHLTGNEPRAAALHMAGLFTQDSFQITEPSIKTSTRRTEAVSLHLPPVDVVLVDDLQDVSRLEPQAGLLAGNQVVVGRVVVVVTLEEDLEARGRSAQVFDALSSSSEYLLPVLVE